MKKQAPPEANFPDRLEGIAHSGTFSPGILIIPAISLLVLVALVLLLSVNPGKTLYFFFLGPFRNIYGFGNMLNAAIPLVLGALGITIAVKSGSLNLGGEGQVYFGAFTSAITALSLSRMGAAGSVIAVLAGFISAGALAAFCGFCKARWNTNELISTFLLSNAVIPVVNYLATGPFLDPETSLQSTRKITPALRLPLILKPSNLSAAAFIAIASVIIVHYFLAKTKKGYELRMAGNNEIFARYGGINVKGNTVLAMFISGGFYGLAGSLAVLGTYYAVIKEFSAGLGWNGLAVALIAGFFPPAIIPAAIFFAWLSAGGRIAMQNTEMTFEVVSIVQAVIFFLATSLLLRNVFARRRRK
ncbi:MAG: ABC transporter permease [Treponema sp.]|nr:ABC transporter permease [Treponema sp.]